MPLINLMMYAAQEMLTQEPQKTKEKLKIRFSLFFDGTNNNSHNIGARERAELNLAPTSDDEKKGAQAYKENGDGGNNSYDNGRTNIAIMEPLVKLQQEGYNHYFTVYIQGQGTEKFEDDHSLSGKAMGALSTGVANRAEEGVQEAVFQLKKILVDYPPDQYEIEKIDVDVFGFSRGAAAARHSISLMLEWLEPETILPNRPLYNRLRGLGYDLTKKIVEVKFAGVYDTVVSVNASQLKFFADNKLNQRAVALATKSVHLCAAEEHRLDFPLHTIQSALDKGKGKQYYLPGVHSDVGGSYNKANDLSKEGSTLKIVLDSGSYSNMLEEKEAKSSSYPPGSLDIEITETGWRRKSGSLASEEVPTKAKLVEYRKVTTGGETMRTSDEVDVIINSDVGFMLERDKEWLIKQGWYRPKEITVKSLGVGYTVVTRRNIKSAYSNIPLKLMARFADENGIKCEPTLIKRANIVLGKEPDLQSLEASINKYVAKMGADKSTADDWIDDASVHHNSIKYPMTDIRHDHLHMSAKTTAVTKLNFGFTPRFTILGKRRRYYYDG